MNDLENLRSKWLEIAEKRLPYPGFDYDNLKPGKFCMHISDSGGQMPCVSSVEVTGFLDSARDALAYMRFAEIPHILEWDSGIRSEEPLKSAESYLSNYDPADAKQILELLALIDSALASDEVTSDMFLQITELFNQTFEDTNPSFQILAWGSLTELLSDPYFSEVLDDAEDGGEEDDLQSFKVLSDLLASDQFDENNEEHLSLAREFLESRFVA